MKRGEGLGDEEQLRMIIREENRNWCDWEEWLAN